MRSATILAVTLLLLASLSFGVVVHFSGANALRVNATGPTQFERTDGLLKLGTGFAFEILAGGAFGLGGFIYAGENFPIGFFAVGHLLQLPSGYSLIQLSSGLGVRLLDIFGTRNTLLLGASYGVFPSSSRSNWSLGPCLGTLIDSHGTRLGLYGLVKLSLFFTGAPLIPFIPTLAGQLGVKYSF